jgi:hypothetical protein
VVWPFRRKRGPLLVPEREAPAQNPRFEALGWTLAGPLSTDGRKKDGSRFFVQEWLIVEEPRLRCVVTGSQGRPTIQTWLVDGQSCASLDVALDRLGVPPASRT